MEPKSRLHKIVQAILPALIILAIVLACAAAMLSAFPIGRTLMIIAGILMVSTMLLGISYPAEPLGSWRSTEGKPDKSK